MQTNELGNYKHVLIFNEDNKESDFTVISFKSDITDEETEKNVQEYKDRILSGVRMIAGDEMAESLQLGHEVLTTEAMTEMVTSGALVQASPPSEPTVVPLDDFEAGDNGTKH